MRHNTRTDLRGHILAAATRSFASVGYKATSLQDIAAAVGCSKAAVLYHFAGKDAILAELIAPAVAEFAALNARLAELDGVAAQRAAVDGFVALVVRYREEMAVLNSEIPELLQQSAFAGIEAMSEQLLEALAGSDSATDRLAAIVVVTGVVAVCAQSAEPPTPPDDADERAIGSTPSAVAADPEELRTALIQIATRALNLPIVG